MSAFDNFGNNLIKLRKQKNMTQMELASVLGISYSTIAMYETNKRQPRMEVVKKIADFFNVPVSELIQVVPIDDNIINVLDNFRDNVLGGSFTFNKRKITKETIELLLKTIDDLKTRIIYFENKEELKQREKTIDSIIDNIKDKYNLSDNDLEDLKSNLNKL